jgi:hypothetical protein
MKSRKDGSCAALLTASSRSPIICLYVTLTRNSPMPLRLEFVRFTYMRTITSKCRHLQAHQIRQLDAHTCQQN